MKKQVVITLVSLFCLFLFFLFPKNQEWFSERIVGYWNDFRNQRNNLNTEYRKTKRWGNDYTFSKQITDFFTANNLGGVVVLIPPSSYFKEKKVDYHVPEPPVFYYYTGLRTVWINSKQASQASWMVVAENGKLNFIPVVNKKILLDSIAAFRKYPISL